jgi:predicted secreted protein
MVGQTASFGAGSTDMWLVKVNSSGDPQWNRTYGGPGLESPISVQQTIDGGYVIAGYMAALDASSGDMWLVKTDSMGNQEWNKTYGGTSNDAAKSVQQTLDGGYVLAGYTDSFGAGSADIWVVKVDSLGEPQWKKTFGGSGDDAANSILQTSDGAYVVAGMYGQYNEPFITQPSDLWLVNVSSSGEMQGSETYGGSLNDYASCVQQTSDGGFIVLGSTGSFGAGDSDFWLLKIAQVTGEFGTDITTTTAPIIPLIFLTGGAAIAAVDAVLIAFIVMKRKQYRAIDSVREP